jgi:hypothetical protein
MRTIKHAITVAAGSADEIRKYATESVALAPDAILASGVSTVVPLQQLTSAVPKSHIQMDGAKPDQNNTKFRPELEVGTESIVRSGAMAVARNLILRGSQIRMKGVASDEDER